MPDIKQIQIGSTTYDIEALHFVLGSLSTPSDWKTYIDNAVSVGLEIVIDDKSAYGDYPDTPASSTTMGKLYLVQLSGQTTSGAYTEFITVRTGDPGNYHYEWEKIGTTAADLTDYAKKTEAAKPGTYSTSYTGSSGSGGAATISTQPANLGSAAGTATVTITVNSGVSSAGAVTITGDSFTFTGTAHTHQLGGYVQTKVDKHTFTPSGSILGGFTIPHHTHDVNWSTATVIKTVGASLTTVMHNATVTNGVLSFATASVLESLSYTTVTAVTGNITTSNAGYQYVNMLDVASFNGDSVTLQHTQTPGAATTAQNLLQADTITGTIQVHDAVATGTIGGSFGIPAHSHNITNSTTTSYTATGSAVVAIGEHSHQVDLPNHTHTIDHSHSLTIPAITTSN